MGLILNPILYGLFKWQLGPMLCENGMWFSPEMSFLDRMAVCFIINLVVLAIMTATHPLKEPVQLPVNEKMDVKSSAGAKMAGIVVVILTVILYVMFW